MRSVQVAAVTLGAAFLLSACGGGGGASSTPSPCPTFTALGRTAPLPRRFPLDSWGTITKVQVRSGFVGAEALTQEQIVELYPRMVRELGAAGYTFLGGENEGFEAELAFADARKRTGSIALRQTACPGEVVIKALLQLRRTKGVG